MFFLILVSLLVAVGFLLAYCWATRTGQFDDDYTPSVRILFEDESSGIPPVDTAEADAEKASG